jgi:cytoskeletal protein CcmA (bactofilin family)
MFKKNKGMDIDAGFSSDAVITPDKTIIGEQIVIEGDISGNGDLVIEGQVKGRIQVEAHHLTVGPKGNVESEIHAADVTISGKLVGNIDAKGKVVITKEADFKGDIKARSISVEDGALLKAVIELSNRNETRKPSADKPREFASPDTENAPPITSSDANKKK